jgi:hypothetical protein
MWGFLMPPAASLFEAEWDNEPRPELAVLFYISNENTYPHSSLCARSSAVVLRRESGALNDTNQPAAWRSRPIVGYFGKEEHFSLMAAGADGEIDAR